LHCGSLTFKGGIWGTRECLWNKEERLYIGGMFGTCEGLEKCVGSYWWRKLKEEDWLHDVGVDGRVTFECTLKKWGGRAWRTLI
jgi:hypothetical protein